MTKQLKPLPGIYLVPHHARYIAEGLKTLIVSAKPAPQAYMNKPIYFIQNNNVYGILTLTSVKGPLPAKDVKVPMFRKHKIKEDVWEEWAKEYPKWNDAVYIYAFKVDDLFVPPIEYTMPRGPQKWIKEIKQSEVLLVTPAEVKGILQRPGKLRDLPRVDLIEWHHIVHMWTGRDWQSKPGDLTKEQIRRFHGLLVKEMLRRGYNHKSALAEPAEDIGQKAREPSPYAPIHRYGEKRGRVITIEEVLKAYEKPIVLSKGFVKIVGGIPNWGESDGDIDERISLEEESDLFHIIRFRLGRALPPEISHRAQYHGRTYDAFTSYVDVYDLALVPADERHLVRMARAIRPMQFVPPLKGYRAYYHWKELEPIVVKTWWPAEKVKQGVYVQKKYDGANVLIKKQGDDIDAHLESGLKCSKRIPKILELAKKILPHTITLWAEVESWKGREHQPREETAGYLNPRAGTAIDDSHIVFNVYDVVFFHDPKYEHHETPGKAGDIHNQPYEVRYKYLKLIDWPQSTNSIPKTGTFNLTPSVVANSVDEIIKATKKVADTPGSEGAMLKLAIGKYSLSGLTPDWLKWKKMGDIHAVVLKRLPTRTSGVYNYRIGVRIPAGWKVPRNRIMDVAGKKYINVGKTFNTSVKCQPGDIITLAFHTLNHYKDKQTGEQYITVYEPQFIEKRPQQRTPDSAEEAITIAKKLELLRIKTKLQAFAMDDKPHKSVMQNHFRGKSVHLDFRIQVGNSVVGPTIAHQKPGEIKEDVDSLAKARAIERSWERYFKTTDKPQTYIAGRRKLWITWKKPEPVAWLNVEGVVKPGEVGATRFEYGVFSIVDRPTVYIGTQKSGFREFFLYGKKFTGRWVCRLLPNPWKEEAPRAEFIWLMWKPEDQTPYVLTRRAVRKQWIPPKGVSCLPPEVRKKIPETLKYWIKEKKDDRIVLRNELIGQIKKGEVKLEGYQSVELQEPEKIEQPVVVSAVLQHHWWEAKVKPVRVGPSEEYWNFCLEWRKDKPLMQFILINSPIDKNKVAATFKWNRDHDWMQKGEKLEFLKPGTKGNPTKATPAYIQIIDKLKVTIYEASDVFVKMDIKGKKWKGHWVAIRTDPNMNLWELRKEERAPKVRGEMPETEEMDRLVEKYGEDKAKKLFDLIGEDAYKLLPPKEGSSLSTALEKELEKHGWNR